MNTSNHVVYEIVPQSWLIGLVLLVLFVYFFFRHMMFVLMFADIILGWLRQFRWFPGKGKRRRTLLHWLIALGVFLSFLAISSSFGWMVLVPN